MGLFNGWKKKRDRYYREKLRQYEEINQKYNLGLKYEDYQPIAWAYAEARAKSERGWLSSILSGGNIFKTLLAIAALVIAVVYPPASPVLAFLQITGAVIMSSYTLYSMYFTNKMNALAMNAQRTASATASLKALMSAEEAKDQLTHFLVYEPYEIFANGIIYKAQNAGSQSYSNSLPYDPSKGLLGQYAKIETDEIINNRAQTTQAGNIEYTSNLLDLKLPLKEADLPLEAVQDGLENKRRIRQKRITQGFMELNELFFNYLGTAQELYERVINQQIKPIEKKMIINDFLDKNKNYQRGLRAEISYLHKKDFKTESVMDEDEIEIENDKMSDIFAQIQNSDKYTTEEKANQYHGSILWLIESLQEIKRNVKIYPVQTITLQSDYANIQAKMLRDSQIKQWQIFYNAKEISEARNALTIWNNAQEQLLRYANTITSNYVINPNIFISAINLKVHITTYNPLTNKLIAPRAEIGLDFFLNPFLTAKPSEVVRMYERLLKGRCRNNITPAKLDNIPFIMIFDYSGESLGLLGISSAEFTPLFNDLPKAKELENFDFTILD